MPTFRENTLIDKENAHINLIVGRRSNGKTYPTLRDAVKDFIESDYTAQFVYVRRIDKDFQGFKGQQVFAGMVTNGWLEEYSKGAWNDIYYYHGQWFLRLKSDDGKVKRKSPPMCFAVSLNLAHQYKSINFDSVKKIIFDEFLCAKGERPLANEWNRWNNLISTIARMRDDVKIYMLANTVTKNSDFFSKYGFDIDTIEQGSIVVKTNKSGRKVALEYCKDRGSVDAVKSIYIDDDGDDEMKMITEGAWETGSFPIIPRKYRKYKELLVTEPVFFNIRNRYYECDIIKVQDMCMLYFHKKTGVPKYRTDIVYSHDEDPELIDSYFYRVGLNAQFKVDSLIATLIKRDRAYYQDNATGQDIHDFLKAN